jgi:hypothetical protein
MKEGLLGGTLGLSSRSEHEEARRHVARWVGSSRARLDVCLVDDAGDVVARTAAPPDADGLRHLVDELRGQRVRAVIESMTGARFVHDTLEELGWDVLVADAQKVKASRRWPARPTASTRRSWPSSRSATSSRRSGCPTVGPARARARALPAASGRHRTTLKNRIHATLMTFGHPCPVSDLFGPGRPRAARPHGDSRSVAAQRRREPRAHRRPLSCRSLS